VTCRARYALELQLVFGCALSSSLIALVPALFACCFVWSLAANFPPFRSILSFIIRKIPNIARVECGAKRFLKPARAYGLSDSSASATSRPLFPQPSTTLTSQFQHHFRSNRSRTSKLHRLRRSSAPNCQGLASPDTPPRKPFSQPRPFFMSSTSKHRRTLNRWT
jgi:hypothetical protein